MSNTAGYTPPEHRVQLTQVVERAQQSVIDAHLIRDWRLVHELTKFDQKDVVLARQIGDGDEVASLTAAPHGRIASLRAFHLPVQEYFSILYFVWLTQRNADT